MKLSFATLRCPGWSLILGLALVSSNCFSANEIPYWKAKDLNPVTFKKPPSHPATGLQKMDLIVPNPSRRGVYENTSA